VQDQSDLAGIQRRIRLLKIKGNSLIFTEFPPALDTNGLEIKVGSTVEIIISYTSFSSRFPRTRGVRKPLNRGATIACYDTDKFGTVKYLQTTGQNWNRYNKEHFITDVEVQIWRAALNLSI